tara:strand:- start:21 stop:221 length:201 start_codon:yes stop_codon:yes gene_type:complete
MRKKYNSVLSLSFSVDHENEDGSDLTGDDILEGISRRIRGLTSEEAFEATTQGLLQIPLEDTIENY